MRVALAGDHVERGEEWLFGTCPERVGQEAEIDSGTRVGVLSEVAERLQPLEHERRVLRQTTDILRKGEPVTAALV